MPHATVTLLSSVRLTFATPCTSDQISSGATGTSFDYVRQLLGYPVCIGR